METLGVHRTHRDHSNCTIVQTSDRSGDGHVSLVRPLSLSSGTVLSSFRKETAICKTGYKPREEAHLENRAANVERNRAEKWTESFDDIFSVLQSTDS